jgi:translation initiation factor IF-3
MYNQRKEDVDRIYINDEIRAYEVRCMGPEGENYGVMQTGDAIRKAREMGLDLIEVSAKAVPPVAKIMDYGKFTYEQKKKAKEVKAKSHVTETKNVQVKIGTGERDKELKAERVDEWLAEGHRVKVDLFLWGRYKYMAESFLTERLNRFLTMVFVPFKVAESLKRSPKGYSCTIERDKGKPLPSEDELAAKRKALQEARKASKEDVEEEDVEAVDKATA